MNKRVKTFKAIEVGKGPVIEYIPTNIKDREELYREYSSRDINLPDYKIFDKGIMLDKNDLVVLHDDFDVSFQYMGSTFHLKIKAGLVTDSASVPTALSVGRIAKISQFSLVAATIHDVLYGLKYFEQVHCDDVFEGFLRYKSMSHLTLNLHMIGVRIGGAFVYGEKNERSAWYPGYSDLYKNGVRVEEYSRLKFK